VADEIRRGVGGKVASNPPPECPTRTSPGSIAETIASRRLASVDSSSTRAP
jgi:hypothetical protein